MPPRRELAEETGLTAPEVHLEQLASYGEPDRDPRMSVVTVVYLALAPDLPPPRAGCDAAAAPGAADRACRRPAPLAFDHRAILARRLDRARAKLEYTPLASAFCPPEFTVAELRHVYEIVWESTRSTQLPPQGDRHTGIRDTGRDRHDRTPAGLSCTAVAPRPRSSRP